MGVLSAEEAYRIAKPVYDKKEMILAKKIAAKDEKLEQKLLKFIEKAAHNGSFCIIVKTWDYPCRVISHICNVHGFHCQKLGHDSRRIRSFKDITEGCLVYKISWDIREPDE